MFFLNLSTTLALRDMIKEGGAIDRGRVGQEQDCVMISYPTRC